MAILCTKNLAVTIVMGLMTLFTTSALGEEPGTLFNRVEIPSMYNWPYSFGKSVTALGDINADGVGDMTVGLPDYGNNNQGAITNFLMDDENGGVSFLTNIATYLDPNDKFGWSVAYLGDLDGAGPSAFALAVGATGDDYPSAPPYNDEGAVYILFFDSNGTLMPGGISSNGNQTHVKLNRASPWLASTPGANRFGFSVAAIGDVNNDGVIDIAVGEPDSADDKGTVWVLFLDTDGTLVYPYYQRISDTLGGFSGILTQGDDFGFSIAGLGDLNGDTIPDIVVGAPLDDDGNPQRGAVYVLFLDYDNINDALTVGSYQKISDTQGGFTGYIHASFGVSCALIGDLDGDSVQDIAVGSAVNEGFFTLFMNTNGTVKGYNFVDSTVTPPDYVAFGWAIAALGDLSGDGFPDLVVGASSVNNEEGAVYIVSLHSGSSLYTGESIWNNPLSGDFGVTENWFPQAVPSAVNPIMMDLGGAYTVNMYGNTQNDSIRVKNGDVTLGLGGFIYELLSLDTSSVVVGELAGETASLTIAGGELQGVTGRIGSGVGSSGSLTISDPLGKLFFENTLCVGCSGIGDLTISNGAYAFSSIATVGANPGSIGNVLVTDPGSKLNLEFSLHVNRGLVTVSNGGILEANLSDIILLNNGTLTGDSLVIGDIVNAGSVSPGLGIGTLTVDGQYRQTGLQTSYSGALNIEMDVTGHDVLNVGTLAYLGGGLIVDLLGGYEPILDERFEFLHALFVVDQFDVAYFPGLSGDKFLKVETGVVAGPANSVSVVVDTLANLLEIALPGEQVDVTGVPTDVAVGDLDGDGDIDTAITLTGSPGSVLLLFNDGTGGFTSSTQITLGNEPSAVAIGDLDTLPGKDIVVTNAFDGTMSMLFNDGSGNFISATPIVVGTNPTDVEIANFDGINGDDLVIVNNGDDQLRILYNDGNSIPNFETLPATLLGTEEDPLNVDPEDIDLDKLARVDLVVTNGTAGTVQMFENLGGSFNFPISMPVDTNPTRIESGDLDGNTYPDFVITNTASGTISVILNNGAFGFVSAVNLPIGANPRSVTTVDLDEDGDLDIAVVANNDINNAVVMILRNDTPAGGVMTLTQAEELGEGDNPVLVVSGDVDGDLDEDLITINSAGAAPRSGGGNRGLLNFMRVHPNDVYCGCTADFNCDSVVDVTDLLVLISDWGLCNACASDLNNDNQVDITDLLVLIGAWGACP